MKYFFVMVGIVAVVFSDNLLRFEVDHTFFPKIVGISLILASLTLGAELPTRVDKAILFAIVTIVIFAFIAKFSLSLASFITFIASHFALTQRANVSLYFKVGVVILALVTLVHYFVNPEVSI